MAKLEYLGQWLEYALYKMGLILFFDKPDPPPPPDYAAAAREQGQNNLEAAIATSVLSNPNIVSPYGRRTVTYDYGTPSQFNTQGQFPRFQSQTPPSPMGRPLTGFDTLTNRNTNLSQPNGFFNVGGNNFIGGTVPVPTITDELSPVGQNLFDTENRIKQDLLDTSEAGLGRVSDAMSSDFNMDAVQGYSVDPGVAGKEDVVQALLGRIQPDLDRRRQRYEESLLQGGHTRGGTAWDEAQEDLYQAENDAYLASVLAGGQEQSRLANLESSRRAQDIQEQAYLRSLPLSELNSLRTGNQPVLPQFQGFQGSNVNAAPIMDSALAQGNFAQQNYMNELSSSNNLMSGLFGIGSAIAGAPAGGFLGGLFG